MPFRIVKTLSVLFLVSIYHTASPQELHVSKVEEIRFASGQFEIVGNLCLPTDDAKNGLVIWIHGSGPNLRTSKFPGAAFFNCFLDNGFAYFRYDKPGSGDSKGSFSDSLLFQERANIASAAIAVLKKHPQIDSTKIGLIGSSQAGYVMPLVLTQRNDVAFMIGLSLPGTDGHEQWAYLLKMQLIHEGYSAKQAQEFSAMHLRLIRSTSKQEFMETVKYFETNPVNIPALNGYDENFAKSLQDWWPLNWTMTQSFNPMDLIAKIKIPVFLMYGAKDTQVDPYQGAEAYRKSLQSAGNQFYEIEIIPNADHNMSFAETGSLREQKERVQSALAPGFVEAIAAWVTKLKTYLDGRM